MVGVFDVESGGTPALLAELRPSHAVASTRGSPYHADPSIARSMPF
jgi:hypothetical protein